MPYRSITARRTARRLLAALVVVTAVTAAGASPANALPTVNAGSACNGTDQNGVHAHCITLCYFGDHDNGYQEGVNITCGNGVGPRDGCIEEPLACMPELPPVDYPQTPLSDQALGVQPGAGVITDIGLCTLNFAFRGPEEDDFYIATAGHCATPMGTRATWDAGEGPKAIDATGHRIGRFVYAETNYPKDFGLIHVDPGVYVNGTVPIPQSAARYIDDGTSSTPTILEYVGVGAHLSDIAAVRTATSALGLSDPDVVYAQGIAVPGDSGAPVITQNGTAVGVITSSGAFARPPLQKNLQAGTIQITRLAPQVEAAEAALDITLTFIPYDNIPPCCP